MANAANKNRQGHNAPAARPEVSASAETKKRGRQANPNKIDKTKLVDFPHAELLTAVPENWNNRVHKPLRIKDFAGEKRDDKKILYSQFIARYKEELQQQGAILPYTLLHPETPTNEEGFLTVWPSDYNPAKDKLTWSDFGSRERYNFAESTYYAKFYADRIPIDKKMLELEGSSAGKLMTGVAKSAKKENVALPPEFFAEFQALAEKYAAKLDGAKTE